jgi:hypothetical protein
MMDTGVHLPVEKERLKEFQNTLQGIPCWSIFRLFLLALAALVNLELSSLGLHESQFVRYAKKDFNWKTAVKHLSVVLMSTPTPSHVINCGGCHTHIGLGFRKSGLQFVLCGFGLVGDFNRNMRHGR